MLRRFFTENLGLKLFALILAVALEFYFYRPENLVTTDIAAKVQLRNLPPRVMVVKPEIGVSRLRVRLKVQGPRPIIEQLKGTLPIFEVVLPKDLKQSFSTEVDVEEMALPVGVKVLEWGPKAIDFEFGKVIRKSLPVEVPTTGETASGFKLENLTVTPARVFVEGPESELKNFKSIKTNPLNITGINSSQRKEISLDEIGKFSSLGVNVVSVDLRVSPLVSKRVIENVPISVIAPPGMAATIEPSNATVVITGPVERLAEIRKDNITLLADSRKFNSGLHQVDIAGVLPEDFEIVTTSPPRVKVTIVKKK